MPPRFLERSGERLRSGIAVDVDQGNNVMYLPLDEIMRNTAPAVRQQTGRRDFSTDSPAVESNYDPRNAPRRPRDGG